jgi:hypothetical protein
MSEHDDRLAEVERWGRETPWVLPLMAEYDRRGAAIERVRAVCTTHTPPSTAKYASLPVVAEVLAALDGEEHP